MPDAPKTNAEFSNVSVDVLFDLEDMLRDECFLVGASVSSISRAVLKWAVDRRFLGQRIEVSSPIETKFSPHPTISAIPPEHYAEDKQEDDPIAREIRAVLDGVVVAKEDPEAIDVGASVSGANADAVAPTAISEVEGADVSTAAPLASTDAPKDSLRDRAGEPWTDDEVMRALELRNQGLTLRETAERLGRPLPATTIKLRKLSKEKAPKIAKNTSGPAEPAPKPVEAVVQDQGPEQAGDMPASGSMAVAGAPDRPTWWRAVEIHLNDIGYANGWSADADYQLVEMLSRGESWFVVADQLERAKPDMVARYRDLIFGNGMEAQSRTLQVLRSRAGIEG